MENALLKEDAWQVVDRLVPFIDEIKKHNGTLITLFHNQSFGDEGNEQKWKTAYEELLQKIL
jgi:hypothetical protein